MRLSILAFFAIVAGCAAPPIAAPRPTSDQIQFAIDLSAKYIIEHQEIAWPPNSPANDPASLERNALATDALLATGEVSTDDPHLQPILAVLAHGKNLDPYTRGVRLRIWQVLWENADRQSRARYVDLGSADATAILKSLFYDGPLVGLWGLHDPPTHDDYATTQSAIAGLLAASEMGGEIPDKTWLLLDHRLRSDQLTDGSWPDGSTALGVSSLLMIRPFLAGNAGLECNGNISDDAVEAGLAWIGKHFDEFKTPDDFCALAQIGAASGHRYFGKVDWFDTIAQRMITRPIENDNDPIHDESMKLLFLSSGFAPVAITKLDYSVPGQPIPANWNERPFDARTLTAWIGRQAEGQFNWQLADLATPIDDLHDSSILYLAGNRGFVLPDSAVAKLRQFVLEGGMILGNADCASAAFNNSFIQLGRRMFPRYEFRELGKDHLIYTAELYPARKMRGFQPIFGLSNGVRELMLLFPGGNPSRAWQMNSAIVHVGAFQIAMDVLQYATDIDGLRPRHDSYIVRPDPAIKPKRTIRLARLMIGENPDPEPGGWLRLAAIMRNDYRVDLQLSAVNPGESLAGFQIVHLTGTTAFHFTPAERQALVDFTHHGGTLIIDAAGGSGVFADSAGNELVAMFGNGAGYRLTWLAPGSALYTLPQAPIGQVKYRRFARKTLVGDARTPHILDVGTGGRCVAFFCPFDLSAGLVGEMVDGVNGYSPDSATALMRNMILYTASVSK